ncbi:hypothetical protein HanRHA438_Chr08g0343091 [Helianthus annuus]|nr:hypothetical protein HanRHA438_Chr08g0343091 [Helianthus annuus]
MQDTALRLHPSQPCPLCDANTKHTPTAISSSYNALYVTRIYITSSFIHCSSQTKT